MDTNNTFDKFSYNKNYIGQFDNNIHEKMSYCHISNNGIHFEKKM